MSGVKLPPGPKGGWPFGDLPKIARDPVGYMFSLKQFGDIVFVSAPPRNAVALYSPDLIEQVLVRDNKKMGKQDSALRGRPLLGDGLLLSEGDFWLRQRRLAQPAFHRDRINAYGTIMVEKAEQMLTRWQDGAVRDIHADMMHVTLAIVGKALFNYEVTDRDADGVGAALDVALEEWNNRTFRMPFLDYLPLPSNFRFQKAIKYLDGLVYGMITERRRTGDDPGDLLSMLLAARDEDGQGMTDRQLRDEVMTILLAGHETTANALTWSFHLLSQHPDVLAKLITEVDEVLGDRAPTLADIPKLPYTEMVVNETMRLYPPAWIFGRRPLQEYELGGYTLPTSMPIMICPFVLHRDPTVFPEPDRFLPERWADGFAKRIHPYAYIPFSGGPRVCIGKQFALMEAVLLLAAITREFTLSALPGRRVETEPLITLRPKGGLTMRLNRRGKSAQKVG